MISQLSYLGSFLSHTFPFFKNESCHKSYQMCIIPEDQELLLDYWEKYFNYHSELWQCSVHPPFLPPSVHSLSLVTIPVFLQEEVYSPLFLSIYSGGVDSTFFSMRMCDLGLANQNIPFLKVLFKPMRSRETFKLQILEKKPMVFFAQLETVRFWGSGCCSYLLRGGENLKGNGNRQKGDQKKVQN